MTRLEKVYDLLKEFGREEDTFDQLSFFCSRHYGIGKGECPEDLERECVSCLLQEFKEEDFDVDGYEAWKAYMRM